MNIRPKFIRLVIASAVGSLLWAGCATSTTDIVIREPAGAERVAKAIESPRPLVTGPVVVDATAIAMAPRDLTKRRPDTHPELRSGLWQGSYLNDPRSTWVVEAPVVKMPAERPVVDSTHLMAYDPVVVNIAADTPPVETPAPGSIIYEASGAERHPRKFWRWHERRSTPPVQIQPVPASPPAPVAPIEPAPPVLQKNEVVPPSSPEPATPLKNENDGPLLKNLFVEQQSP